MYKILIKGYFKNCDINETIHYNNEGNLLNNIITFKDKDTRLKINIKSNSIIFTKDDINSKLEHEFILNKKTSSKYYLKEERININIPICTKKLEKKDKSIKIEYDLINNQETSKNILYIEYEVLK